MYINRFLGRSLHFKNGFHIGFNWMHGNGHSSKTAAVLAGYHHPNSITWRWSLPDIAQKAPSFKAEMIAH